MIFNPNKTIKYQLYLLQLENYEIFRYFKLLGKKGFFPPKESLRKSLVWTIKARALMLMAIGLHMLIGVMLFWLVIDRSLYFYIIVGLIWYLVFTAYCLLLTTALLFLFPVDWLVKKIIVFRAKLIVKSKMLHVKVIGIAGSYGKTTMKEVLKEVLGFRFQVLATPESVNTPVGIARWVLKNFNAPNPSPVLRTSSPTRGEEKNNTPSSALRASSPLKGEENIEIAIIEMGEHYQGDIQEICEIVTPDIAVVTGINEAHLERMGSMETVTQTIFEIVQNAKSDATCLLNGDDENIEKYNKEYIGSDQKSVKYSVSGIQDKDFNPDRLGWNLKIEGAGDVFVNLLGEYALGDVDCAVKIAREFGMTNEAIKQGIEKIRPVEHRLFPILRSGNILVIDDAYNGNSVGVKEAIKTLGRFTGRRKLYITPGLVETGQVSREVHLTIGRQLAKVADVVILIKNSVTPIIEEGIKSANPPSLKLWRTSQSISQSACQVIWFDTAMEAHASLSKILKPNDVILFQNDWGDQYL